jgi:hypothetical protein
MGRCRRIVPGFDRCDDFVREELQHGERQDPPQHPAEDDHDQHFGKGNAEIDAGIVKQPTQCPERRRSQGEKEQQRRQQAFGQNPPDPRIGELAQRKEKRCDHRWSNRLLPPRCQRRHSCSVAVPPLGAPALSVASARNSHGRTHN